MRFLLAIALIAALALPLAANAQTAPAHHAVHHRHHHAVHHVAHHMHHAKKHPIAKS